MDNEYGTMFKRLMNERNELRKYIIDICKSLDIDTSQSILGVNCLEFYAVLCSTAENKIRDLQEQLKRKEQECEELKQWKKGAENLFKAQIDNADKIINRYKQALDEIEKLMPKFDTSMGCDYGDYDCENCSDLDEDIVCTYKLKKVIKGIINKAKDSE